MAKSHSTRGQHRGRTKRPRPPPLVLPLDLPAILGRFSTALALLETVARAFTAAEDDVDAGIASVGAYIVAMELAVKSMREVYNEWDLALGKLAAA